MNTFDQNINVPEFDFSCSFENLFRFYDNYTDTRTFIKNLDCKYVFCSKTYADLLGTSPEEMLGKGDYDYYEKSIADLYLEEDQKVLNGQSFVNQRWMVPDHRDVISWCISHKFPLKNNKGEICGIFGTFRDLKMAGIEAKPFNDLSEVVEYLHNNYTKDISSQELASLIDLSVGHLNRKFKNIMGETPIQYLLKVRINKAAERLKMTDDTIAEIAYTCGFNNQTYFNRQFKKLTGLTPKMYRSLNT